MKYTKKIEILDSTLRDGAQGAGVNFSVADKIEIVKALDRLGVTFIEGGNPAGSKIDCEFFQQAKELQLKNSQLVAFGATVKPGVSPEEDRGMKALLKAETKFASIVGKASLFHVKEVLQVSAQENLDSIKTTLKYLKKQGKQVLFDAEHFFDGYKENKEYAMEVLRAAFVSGAYCLVLCDTNGGSFPQEIEKIVAEVTAEFSIPIGIHAHDDMGLGVANSHMAVSAGVTHVQGCFLGTGERCGNAALSTLIANLQLKLHYSCIPKERISKLTTTAKVIADVLNMPVLPSLPYVGKNAFRHKAGMHADGVQKEKTSFEHIAPETVGNKTEILLSDLSGRSSVAHFLQNFQMNFDKNAPEVVALTEKLKELVFQGYDFETATASLEMLFLKEIRKIKPFFDIEYYKVMGEKGIMDLENASSAIVKVRLGDKSQLNIAEGRGLVHAMDKALRAALIGFYPELDEMRIADYKVRVVDNTKGADATTRVLMVSTNGKETWTTVGASPDLIKASVSALVDSFEYYLLKHDELA